MFGITIKILRSFAYLVRYALRARRATKALRCFIILTLTLFLRCIFQIRPCVRKIVATRKCSWHVCASCCLKRVFVRKLSQSNHTPCPRKSLGWGGGSGSCWLGFENCGQAWRGFMRRDLPQDICFSTYESVACSVTTQLLTLTWWEFWYETEERKKNDLYI